MPKSTPAEWYHTTLNRLLKVHAAFLAFFLAYTILSGAWNVITHEAQVWRVTALAILVASIILLALLNNSKNRKLDYYRYLLLVLIGGDIIFASLNVFSQRGMASRAVAFYALPIIVSAAVLQSHWLIMTALTSAASYIFAAWWYFHTHFNEGYKAELIFEVGLYSIFFFVLSACLLIIIRPSKK